MKCNVRVIEAADIPNQDETNLYIRLNTSSSNTQNETDVATSNPPHWDSTEYTFQFTEKRNANLEITLLNGDKVGIDKEIGNSTLSLSDLETDTDTDKWVELKADNGSNTGRVHLIINITEEENKDLDDILNMFDDDIEVKIPEFNKAGLENKEFQSKLKDDSEKIVTNESSEFNIDSIVGNDSSSDGDLLLKATTIAVTVINIKNADQIPQIASNIESTELYCALSLSENDKTVKTKTIKDPSSSSWNQTFKFCVNDTSSAKIVANLYNQENEDIAKGEFPLDDIVDQKNITVDLQSTQNPSVSAQLEISLECIPGDELSEEESSPLDNLIETLDEKEDNLNEAEPEAENNEEAAPQTQEEQANEVEHIDALNEQIETHDENENPEQIDTLEEVELSEPQNDELDQIETHEENDQQEPIETHDENEQPDQIETHEENNELNQIQTLEENDEANQIQTLEENDEANQIQTLEENDETNQIQTLEENDETNQIQTLEENDETNQIQTLEENEQQEPVETHDETVETQNEQQDQIEPQIETYVERDQLLPAEANDKNEQQDQIESPEEIEQIEPHEEEEHQKEEQNQIETYDDHPEEYQIDTHDEIEHNEHQEFETKEEETQQEPEQHLEIDEENEEGDIIFEDDNQQQDHEEDYEEEQFNENNAPGSPSSPRPRTKEEKYEHSIKKLLIDLHELDKEDAEKEKEQVYNFVKSKADELYQQKVILQVEKKEERSRSIVLKLTKNSEELEKLHQRMSNPENMSPKKLKREIKKLENEINMLNDEIIDISNQNDELENIVFALEQQVNNSRDE